MYLQDELQKELDAERDAKGFKDRAPIVQEALSHWLEKHRGRTIKSRSQVRKSLKTKIADVVVPRLSKEDINKFRREKPHNPNGYKHYVEASDNPPEVKEALCKAVDEAFETTREEALEEIVETPDKKRKHSKEWYRNEAKRLGMTKLTKNRDRIKEEFKVLRKYHLRLDQLALLKRYAEDEGISLEASADYMCDKELMSNQKRGDF